MKKIKPTHILVAVFVALLLLATKSAEAQDGPRIALGKMIINSDESYGEFGFEFRNWEAAAAQLGNGYKDPIEVYSLSYIVRPDWHILGGQNYYRIGGAYVNGDAVVDGLRLVGDTNYRLGVGLQWSIAQVEYFHYSSADIHGTNTGLDGVQIRFVVPF